MRAFLTRDENGNGVFHLTDKVFLTAGTCGRYSWPRQRWPPACRCCWRSRASRWRSWTAVYLAGGFGVYLDPASAAAIGMLPQLPAGRLHSIGNAASLAGASMLALDASRAADALQTAERCRYIELSGRADFADAFTGGMTYEPVTRR